MMRQLLSPRAEQDLDEIWDFTAERWGDDQAEAYVRAIWAAVKIVAEDPRRGQECNVRAGYLKYGVGRHVLFFKPLVDGVEVIRILHQRMDFERHL